LAQEKPDAGGDAARPHCNKDQDKLDRVSYVCLASFIAGKLRF
jgi:hypothetical protein